MFKLITPIFILLALSSSSFTTSSGMETSQTLRQATSGNPLIGIPFHKEIFYRRKVKRAILRATENDKRKLFPLLKVPVAFWLDTKKRVQKALTESGTAEQVLKEASRHSPNPLVTFMVYNLPNRDCGSGASLGEICCKYKRDGTCDLLDTSNKCESGIREYKTEFIDVLAKTVKRYCNDVPMAFVIEPDSFPNLVTNLDNPKCGNPATQAAYRAGVKYAVRTLKWACPKATIYVDGAHGGWLGWENNSKKFLKEIKRLGITSLIRGFALNVANYQEMGTLCPKVGTCLPSSPTRNHQCCRKDACKLSSSFNPGFNLLNYAASLKYFTGQIIPGFDVHFILDTGRNGVPDARKASCANWCNIRDAGLGLLPTTNTAVPSMIDAYMWLKPPGESDGCTETLEDCSDCRRPHKVCGSADSVGSRTGEPCPPEAGGWFDEHIKRLARNARLFGDAADRSQQYRMRHIE